MDVMASGLYPEGSITRRVNRENVLLLGGGRALLMQLAHPMVAAGVDEHSDFRTRPIQRLRRTVRMTMAVVFGDQETALTAGRAVNQAHGKVRGRDYRALDPELLQWVHATLVDSALVTYETFVKPLSERDREDFYQESKVLGELLGIPRERFPATLAEFTSYMERTMSEGGVRVGPRALELGSLRSSPAICSASSLAWACITATVSTGISERKNSTMRGIARERVRTRSTGLISAFSDTSSKGLRSSIVPIIAWARLSRPPISR